MARCLKSFGNDHHAEKNNFLQGVVAVPARRALENKKIDSLEKLSYFSENEIMQLHGFGKNTMKKLKNYMQEQKVSFKKN
jgi:ERCC4-type nuclease